MATQLALTWGSIQPHFVWASSDIESHGFLAHVTHHGTRIRVCPCIRKISIFHLASSSSLFLLVVLISHIAIAVIAAYQLSLRPYNSNIPSYCCILAPTRLTGTKCSTISVHPQFRTRKISAIRKPHSFTKLLRPTILPRLCSGRQQSLETLIDPNTLIPTRFFKFPPAAWG